MIKKVLPLLFILILSLGCLSLKEAYVPAELLKDGWYEDVGSEERGSAFLGIQKWSTKVYRKGDVSYLSVTSLKFIIMQSRNNLIEKVEEDIKEQAERYGIVLDDESKISGERETFKGHKTSFVIYNGTKGESTYRIIGEVWSCSKSGISVICMGFSNIDEVDGIQGWRQMVADPYGSIDGIKGEGLIYKVVCH